MNERLQLMVHGMLFALGIGWVLYVGKGVFVPIVFSILVAYVIVGLTRLLLRLPFIGRFLPRQIGYTLAALIIALAVSAVVSLVATSLAGVVALAPQYEGALLNAIQDIAVRLGFESPTWATLRQELLTQIDAQRVIGSTVISASSIVSSVTVVLLYVAFLLIEQRAFSAKLAHISADQRHVANIRKVITHINARVGTYLALKTLVSLVQGLISWAILALFGVEFAMFWAVLIGLLNYIPYIGSFLGVVLPAAFAILQFADLNVVLMLVLALSAAQFVVGFFLDPYLMGNSLNLSPFVILVSLAVWSAIWGIAGAFLAVPITACIALVFAEFEGTRPIAVLLSKNGQI